MRLFSHQNTTPKIIINNHVLMSFLQKIRVVFSVFGNYLMEQNVKSNLLGWFCWQNITL